MVGLITTAVAAASAITTASTGAVGISVAEGALYATLCGCGCGALKFMTKAKSNNLRNVNNINNENNDIPNKTINKSTNKAKVPYASFAIDNDKVAVYDTVSHPYPLFYSEKHLDGVQIGTNYYVMNDIVDGYKDAVYTNGMIVGAIGSSKSSGMILPNLMNPSLSGTLIINDPSGELYQKTAKIQKSFGRKVIRIAPGSDSDKINILRETKTNLGILNLSEQILRAGLSGKVSADTESYINAASNLLTSLFYYVKYYKETYNEDVDNIAEVLSLLTTLDLPDIQNLISECPKARQFFLAYNNKKKGMSKFVDGTIDSIDTLLKFYKIDSIIELTKETTFDINSIRKEPHAIYITGSIQGNKEDKVITVPIIKFIIDKALELTPRKNPANKLPVHFFLDEFANMGKLDGISNIYSQARKEKISIYTAFQDWKMLEDYYSDSEINTISSSSAHKLFLLNNKNSSTIDAMMKFAGEEEVWVTNTNYGYNPNGEMEVNNIKQELKTKTVLDPKKIRELQKGEGILICASQPVLDDIKIKPWFETERFSKYLGSKFDTNIDNKNNDIINYQEAFTSIIASKYLDRKEEARIKREQEKTELKAFQAERANNQKLAQQIRANTDIFVKDDSDNCFDKFKKDYPQNKQTEDVKEVALTSSNGSSTEKAIDTKDTNEKSLSNDLYKKYQSFVQNYIG
jgi:type IV secretion system protein VirD4